MAYFSRARCPVLAIPLSTAVELAVGTGINSVVGMVKRLPQIVEYLMEGL